MLHLSRLSPAASKGRTTRMGERSAVSVAVAVKKHHESHRDEATTSPSARSAYDRPSSRQSVWFGMLRELKRFNLTRHSEGRRFFFHPVLTCLKYLEMQRAQILGTGQDTLIFFW